MFDLIRFIRGVMAKSIPWKSLQDQYFSDIGYRKIKEELQELRESENKKRLDANKQVCSFMKNSPIEFNELTNFNEPNKAKRTISEEVIEFMHLVMDDCTHLLNFDAPVDTSLVKIISANEDCYILRDGVNDFESIWPGSQVEYIDKGHVSAFVSSQSQFRKTIIYMLDRLIEKHYSN